MFKYSIFNYAKCLKKRNREKSMLQKKEEEFSRLNTEHRAQKQQLISEFKEAQEILKEKIIETEEA